MQVTPIESSAADMMAIPCAVPVETGVRRASRIEKGGKRLTEKGCRHICEIVNVTDSNDGQDTPTSGNCQRPAQRGKHGCDDLHGTDAQDDANGHF